MSLSPFVKCENLMSMLMGGLAAFEKKCFVDVHVAIFPSENDEIVAALCFLDSR